LTVRDNHNITPRWLCIREACAYASMGLKKMKQHIKEGDIYGKKSGKWFIDRYSIDAFLSDGIMDDKIIVEKILASLR
jgi:hypothetical protein